MCVRGKERGYYVGEKGREGEARLARVFTTREFVVGYCKETNHEYK